MSDIAKVVSIAIHPAIGFARVGNSQSFFVGPEIPGRHPAEKENLRDSAGAFKRQAARFRLFGRDASGSVICEIAPQDATIRWTVHLANTKAAWYEFNQALDIPASKGELPGVPPVASKLRNPDVQGGARAGLIIDPGPKTVMATGQGAAVAFDTGTFLGQRVDLGSAFMQDDGALVVLGGFGTSSSPVGAPITDFANNSGWHDDVSDGPVDATVEIAGRSVPVLGAWVIVGPPNFAPGITPIVTGWDLLLDLMLDRHPELGPARPVFGEHIQPLLERVAQTQWVNSGFARQFGAGSPSELSSPALLAHLSDPSDNARLLRQTVFSWFRDPTAKMVQTDRIPAVYGDAVIMRLQTRDPLEWMAIPKSQYAWLRRWADGDFAPDPRPPFPDAPTAAERAAALDRAALEDSTGGPFHPGIEFTWPLRQPMLHDPNHPFRIRRRTLPQPSLPPELTSSVALAAGGPLDGSTAGDITRWMALPWQTDTASCLSAYEAFSGEYIPTFWPARVPNDVVTEQAYRVIMDPNASSAERYSAFSIERRRKWLRGFSYAENDVSRPPFLGLTDNFVKNWPEIGLVSRKPGPAALPGVPDPLWVEIGRREPAVEEAVLAAATAAEPGTLEPGALSGPLRL
jgi:L-Lysine epsilon oxidase N-terminal/L-lysine epsilon oxidase C-terminal domain